ncbi:MAG: ATP phosphoribosyltransferase regulatory subunit [Synergistaceae bacterium]|nr:ATP phosphoribosyltransferase regulatory subunit [Synergistaceae bacterium]
MPDYRLRPEELAALNLRSLYSDYGYSFYRMSRFEEYDFYADKKDFLLSKNILTFTDADGKLMALRPDVTLSIIRHIRSTEGVQKFFYDEKVYRVPRNAENFHEIAQSGIECIGNLSDDDVREVLELAVLSLHTIADGRRCVLDVSHAGLIASLVHENRNDILKCLAEKNIHGLKSLDVPEEVIALAELEGSPESALPKLRDITGSHALDVLSMLEKYHGEIHVDFSTVNSLNYYNGIVFSGYIEGISESILSGGQYDNLMSMMGHKNVKGLGFAVNLSTYGDTASQSAAHSVHGSPAHPPAKTSGKGGIHNA